MRRVAFLRGMNLGKRRLKNPELCAAMNAAPGVSGATAFLASGNVVFDTQKRSLRALQETIERTLKKELAYEVPTFLRTMDEVATLADAAPFDPKVLAKGGKVQVMLLGASPRRRAQTKVLEFSETFAFAPGALLWLPRGGVSDADLDLRALEDLIGSYTMRTQRTLQRLVAKFA
ncbi:MAG: DUF1697 domain-containing protein [Myxococcota bacterium]